MYLQQRRISTQALQHQHHWRNQKSQHDQDFRNHDHETTIEADLTWVGWDLTCEGGFPAVAWLTGCSSAADEIWSEFIWDEKYKSRQDKYDGRIDMEYRMYKNKMR